MSTTITAKQAPTIYRSSNTPSQQKGKVLLPWEIYSSMTPLEQVVRRCKVVIGHIFNASASLSTPRMQVSESSHEIIHKKLQNPSYIDGIEVLSNGSIMSNDSAIADFLAVVGNHHAAHIFLSEGASVRMSDLSTGEIQNILRHLRTVLMQLKKISHGSGRVEGRKNGALAFSHWFEAGYLYLLYDPRPSIEGLYQVLCHDIYEDPNWYIKPTARPDNRVWRLDTISSDTPAALKKRVERLIGTSGGATIERHFTKPPATFTENEMMDGWILTARVYQNTRSIYGTEPANAYLAEKAPHIYERGQVRRNDDFIQKIIALNDRDFLKKIPDLLSNLRTLDAFFMVATTDTERMKWKIKMLRKLEEICKYYFPRLVQTGEIGYTYLVLIRHEMISLNDTFGFGLDSKYPSYFSKNWEVERNILYRKWMIFHEIASRPLPRGQSTQRPSLELIV